ncbi:UNVERIFIED_CONTAM: hypothetical protein FKN15_073181 [Acipenser sinensis]
MAARWQDIAAQHADVISSRLRELLSTGLDLLHSKLGVDLGLKPEQYPPWVLLLTAFIGLLVIVVVWAAACVRLCAGRKRGARASDTRSHATKTSTSKSVKGEEQKKKNKKKTVEKDIAAQHADVISSRLRELLSTGLDLLHSKLGVDLGLKPEQYPPWVLLLTAFIGLLVIVVVWAAACVRLCAGRKRGARASDTGSHATKTSTSKSVKGEEQKKKNKKKTVEKKPQNGCTILELQEDYVKATSAWETKISNREKKQQRRRDKVTEDSSLPETQGIVATEHPTSLASVPVLRKIKGTREAGPRTTIADLQLEAKIDDQWSGTNGLSTEDPSSDWNAPTEEWGNWDEQKALPLPQLVGPATEVQKVSDEKEKVDSAAAAAASGKSKKKKKKKQGEDSSAPVQETGEPEKEPSSELEVPNSEPEMALPEEAAPAIELVKVELERPDPVMTEPPVTVLDSTCKNIASQVPQRLLQPEPPVSTTKQSNVPPLSQISISVVVYPTAIQDYLQQLPGNFPYKEEIMSMNATCLVLIVLMFIGVILAFKAYLIACVWNCYQYVSGRGSADALVYMTTNDTMRGSHNAETDPCALGNHGCEHECVNTEDSFICRCRAGYTLNPDGKTCKKTDPCALGNHGCEHECVNTEDSFICRCRAGYTLNRDGKTCKKTDRCALDNHGCEHECVNTEDSFICRCYTGYILNSDEKTCRKTDRCALDNHGCEHECVNTEDSFICRCYTGYILNSDEKTCRRMDYCALIDNGCEHLCLNTEDSYICQCFEGYTLNDDRKTCRSRDICSTVEHGCEQLCVNTGGSYICKCLERYTLSEDGKKCKSRDICSTVEHGCEQLCVNTGGSYICKCLERYTLSEDGKRCKRCADGVIDLVFVIDGSKSLGPDNFELVKQFVKGIIDSLDISPTTTRVGLLQYSTKVRSEFTLAQFSSVKDVNEAVSQIKYMGRGSMTGNALKHMLETSFTEAEGARPASVPKVTIVFTDGRSQDDVSEWSTKAQKNGITMYAVGVGKAIEDELRQIASKPQNKHLYYAEDFSKMGEIADKLKSRICEEKPSLEDQCKCENVIDFQNQANEQMRKLTQRHIL